MSFGKVQKMGGENLRGKSPRVLSANSRSHQPPRQMEGRGSRFPQLGNRLPQATFPPNDQPKTQSFGGDFPLKFCAFGWSPSRPIGKLADAQTGMAWDFQSAADHLDQLRLKIRDHPCTQGDVLRRLDRSNVRRNAFPPGGAPSWAGGEGGPIIGLNGRYLAKPGRGRGGV